MYEIVMPAIVNGYFLELNKGIPYLLYIVTYCTYNVTSVKLEGT